MNENDNKKSFKDFIAEELYEAADVFISSVVMLFVVFVFLFRVVGVVGPSMNPTLSNGDWLAVSSRTYSAQAGDIVIATQPNVFHKPLVKRVIATEGQEVFVDFEKGEVVVDGVVLDEPYVNEPGTDKTGCDVEFPVTVPEGCVFVMGDNRNHSTDSRSSSIGFIDEKYILGKVSARLYPFGDFKVN